jgi:hypothetical protein
MIEKLRAQRGHWHAVEREARTGDRVTIDFDGTIDGEPFRGGAGNDVPVLLGEGRMLKDFEAGLAGLTAGEERTIEVVFPRITAPRRSPARPRSSRSRPARSRSRTCRWSTRTSAAPSASRRAAWSACAPRSRRTCARR